MHGVRGWRRFRIACATAAGAALLVTQVYADSKSRMQAGPSAFSARLRRVLSRDAYKHATWAIAIADAESLQPIFRLSDQKLVVPASVTKLFSTAAALRALGPDFRFITSVYRTGEISNGELHGNLVLKASGDPNLSGRWSEDGHLSWVNHDHTYANFQDNATLTNTDCLAGLDDLARQVAAAGIHKVQNVLVDDRLFEHAQGSGSGPTKISPIVVNDNVIDVLTSPGAQPGQPARVLVQPQTNYAHVESTVTTVDSSKPTQISVEQVDPHHYVVRGTIAVTSPPRLKIAVIEDPSAFARVLLIERLAAHDVLVNDDGEAPTTTGPLPAWASYESLPVVAKHVSPPLHEELKVILKVSHNLGASLLPLWIGQKQGHSTVALGVHDEGEALQEIGVNTEAISFAGGAGGTRSDMVTPQSVLELLHGVRKQEFFPFYHDALPILGVDGTLADAIEPSSPARGKIYAKTGTHVAENIMSGGYLVVSKAIAGYMVTSRGRQLVFAVFLNNVRVKEFSEIEQQGRVLGEIAEMIYKSY